MRAQPPEPRLSQRTLTLALALLASLAFALAPAAAASARTFKVATVAPDGSAWMQEMRAAAKIITERTEGRVKIKFYPGGVMGNEKTVLRKLRAGQLQGGAFTSGALASLYPDVELYSLPLVFRSYEEVDHVRADMDPTLIAGLEEAGLVPLAVGDGGFAYIMSQKPLRRVEDLEGAKAWIVEDDIMSLTTFQVAGITPIQMPLGDVYTALQTGLLDTVAAPPVGTIAFQWHTKVQYLTDVPLMYLVGIFAMDKRAFGKLSPADQAVVREVVGEAAARLDAGGRDSEAEAKEALREQGLEFVTVSSQEELERWRDISRRAAARLRASGRYSERNMDRLDELLRAYRSQRAASPGE